jgi:hypothetical protein
MSNSYGRQILVSSEDLRMGLGLAEFVAGMVVMAAFVAPLLAGSFVFPPGAALDSYLAYTAVLCGLLVWVCWLKGEPPRWRWGKNPPKD